MITLVIIIFTSAFSLYCMNDPALKYKYIFHPYSIAHFRQHYRFLSHAFIHADFFHLLFNMYALWLFGNTLETILLPYIFGDNKIKAELFYIFLYTGGIYAASVTEFFRYRNRESYSSLGASGAVNAVIFSYILCAPDSIMGLMFLPIPMQAWIFGIIFLIVSYFLGRRNRRMGGGDNIGHDAHFWGAVFGFVLTGLFDPRFPELFTTFFKKLFFWL